MVRGEFMTTKKILQRALRLACEELYNATDSCPIDSEWPLEYACSDKHCQMSCEDNPKGKCYLDYFLKQATKELEEENETKQNTEEEERSKVMEDDVYRDERFDLSRLQKKGLGE